MWYNKVECLIAVSPLPALQVCRISISLPGVAISMQSESARAAKTATCTTLKVSGTNTLFRGADMLYDKMQTLRRPFISHLVANAQGIAPFGQDICLLACSSPGKGEAQPEGPSSEGAEDGQEGVRAGTQRPEVTSQLFWRQCEDSQVQHTS